MSKLLLDQNLSRRLISKFAPQFPGSAHVVELGLDRASDREIFDFARLNDFAIVSKDSDFDNLSVRFGAPPKIIWLRLGNASTAQIADASACAAVFGRRGGDIDGDFAGRQLTRRAAPAIASCS